MSTYVHRHGDEFTGDIGGHSISRSLNEIMETDHVIEVHEDQSITEPEDIYAPSVVDGAIEGSDWEFFSLGYTQQQGLRYKPWMHASEYVAGKLAEDILSAAGTYVAVSCDWLSEEEVVVTEGWVVLKLKVKD